ncbi:hypothetical protein NE619_17785 [Anaerovorax odorimutans]|uniref:Uncharacterized protein n=1 Tax=Anaerovorax odorimutans TaxID=109327 RepID=A0ABT1RTP6_9FIRM|nr:hypothetical protein [Anaerovorax odorimutans]MCQ4638583.1 hypothetical protein [Anaerovorax odorimutans]
MVEVAKEILNKLFDQAEKDTGIARIPVRVIRYCAVTKSGTRLSKNTLKQARQELGLESYRIDGDQYWERRRSENHEETIK